MKTRSFGLVAIVALGIAGGGIALAQSSTEEEVRLAHAGGYDMGRGGDRRGHHMRAGGHRGEGGRSGRRGSARLANLIETYDADGDGAVTQAEIDTVRAERLQAFDSDGNGTLNIEEYEALWLDAMRERMVDRFQSHDDDGDGVVTVEEFGEDFARMVARADRNGDGLLNQLDLGRAAVDRPTEGQSE